GVGGHLTALRRTRVGPFGLDAARSLEALAAGDEAVDAAVVPLSDAVARAFPVRRLDEEQAEALSHGRRLAATGTAGVVGAFAPDGRCIALLEDAGEQARPTVVFAPAGG
ncbi:MAG: tRNA pseudouridine synthase, partial [Frankiales bacterium]|nr:tRNA pseudouridine synthase [Frankiales bacterium]